MRPASSAPGQMRAVLAGLTRLDFLSVVRLMRTGLSYLMSDWCGAIMPLWVPPDTLDDMAVAPLPASSEVVGGACEMVAICSCFFVYQKGKKRV